MYTLEPDAQGKAAVDRAACGVRVWSWRHAGSAERLAPQFAVLDAADRRDVARLRSPDHRASVILSRAMVRGVLAAELGLHAPDLRFSRICPRCGDRRHGKPVLMHPKGTATSHFSVSRTGGLIVVAVANAEVGVDAERLGMDDVATVARVVLSAQERRRWNEWTRNPAADRLLEIWVAKEAYLKGSGLGLVRDPSRVEVDPQYPRWSPVEDDDAPTRWAVRLLHLGRRWVGALALEREVPSISYQTWRPD